MYNDLFYVCACKNGLMCIKRCKGLNICVPPQKNSYVETIPNVMVFRGETLKGLRISALIKEPFRDFPGGPGG